MIGGGVINSNNHGFPKTSSKLRRKNPQAELKKILPHNISIWDFQNYFVMGGVKNW